MHPVTITQPEILQQFFLLALINAREINAERPKFALINVPLSFCVLRYTNFFSQFSKGIQNQHKS